MKTLDLARGFLVGILPPRKRTHLEFAEQEIVFADGPRRGLKFESSFMPFTRLILDEYGQGRYRRFFITGPAQAGKTILGFIIPAMYHLFEIGENVILGAPTVELGQAIYRERLLPSIRMSRYAKHLPREGLGSKGGASLAIQFRHGPILRFMGAGGGDQQRSSHPARVVILTEIDKMDTPGKGSREMDPIGQLEARSDAFGDRAVIYGECTTSTERGRIYREVNENGTGSTPWFRCPHCSVSVPLERENFHGHEEAQDVLAARAKARFNCPSCLKLWTEEDRQLALANPIIVAHGQTLDQQGNLIGAAPLTNTFGFRWTALASSLRTMADIAEKEFVAEHSGNEHDRRGLAQFVWARPYQGELQGFGRIEAIQILEKIVQHERGVVPPNTVRLTMGIDVGSYVCWWVLIAWQEDAQGHVVDFGSIDVPQPSDRKNQLSILAALRGFRDTMIRPGWSGRSPDRVVVDSGYEQEVVYAFVQESGQGRFVASKGFGSTSRNGPFRRSPVSTSSRQVGNHWILSAQAAGIGLLEISTDHWKATVQDGFSAPSGAAGSITLFSSPKNANHMRIFARQITAEYREIDPTPNTEFGYRWVVASRQNHYLDCCSMARVAADMLGVRALRPVQTSTPARKEKQEFTEQRIRQIRTRY